MSNSYQNIQDDASDVVIIGESPGFKIQPSQVSYQPSPQQYQTPNYQGNNNNFQGNNNNYQSNNNSFQTSSQNFQGQNYNQQNFQALNNVTPQKNRGYANINVSPSIQGQGYNQFTSPPRQQNYRAASPRFQSPGRGGHQQFNLSPRQQNPRPLLSAQQLHEILNSPKGKRLTQQQRNYLIQQQALREKQLQQAATPPRSVAPPRQTTPVAVRYQINNSPSYTAPLERRPSQETNFVPPVADPFKNLPREPVTIDLVEPDREQENQSVTSPPLSMESSDNASGNLMSTLDDLNREKQEELNAVFAETNTDIETDTADENGNPNDINVLNPANDTINNRQSPDLTTMPLRQPSTESVVPKIMEEIMIAKQEKTDSDGETEDVLPKLGDKIDDTPSVSDIAMDNTEKNKDGGVLSDASNSSNNQDVVKKRGRPKKTPFPFVDESDPGIRALIENGLDDPYSPEVDADDDEDYCPKPKKRRSKVHSKPLVRPSSTETANTTSDSGIGTSVSSNDHADDAQAFGLDVPASDRQLRVKLTQVLSTQIPETVTDNNNPPDGSKENSDGEPLAKIKPLILRLHHQKFSEDRRFKTFKNLSTSVRKAKLHAKRSKKKLLSPEKVQSEGLQDANVTEVPMNEDQSNLETRSDTTVKKPLREKRGRKKIQTKPVTVKRGRGRPRLRKASPQKKKDLTNDSSVAVSHPTGLVWLSKETKNKNLKSDTTREPCTEEITSLPSKYPSRSLTPQARSEISLPPPVLPSELHLLPSIVAPQENPPDISVAYVDQKPLASTSKLDEEPISPPVYDSTSRRPSECSSTRSSKKHNKKKANNNGVAKEIEAVVSGLFGESFMNMSESSGYTVNITFDVEKKPPFPCDSNGTQAKSEKTEESGTKNLRERKQNLEKCNPNFFTNSELCAILQKRITNHPGIGSDLKAAYSDSIQHVQRLLDGNSK
ncbi:hypothetical protein LOTGIDRAFT_237651 [Lottia gigantea]|uniref:Uncharacterized protein n=1 Tax=Lottia gigantea TaxID=225164 RepID=V4B7G8_LOTGI|nr:hypothetical protein LOTGIDRAFT_237651 [Lottia gigantea]ESP03536.1 hypothetical protein LOTGIDRAFT_237651 [Lottia gigantea]